MFVISLKSFKLIAWKLWEELNTQTCYSFFKSNLKMFKLKTAFILLKVIFQLKKVTCPSSICTSSICIKFQTDCLKYHGEVDNTNFYAGRKDGRTDVQTDGQRRNIMPPDYSKRALKQAKKLIDVKC